MTRPTVTWLLFLVAACLPAGCDSGKPPRMKNAPEVRPDSIEVKDRIPDGGRKKGMPKEGEKKIAQ